MSNGRPRANLERLDEAEYVLATDGREALASAVQEARLELIELRASTARLEIIQLETALNQPISASDRSVFRLKGKRPTKDEQRMMKQAVMARDGLTDCFWCRKPFTSSAEATLEHILPLADGGQHDLRNCTLACEECNLRNEPRVQAIDRADARAEKAKRAALNRVANGGEYEGCTCASQIESCDSEVAARFAAISRQRNRPMKFADASFLLKNIHRQLGRLPPSQHEKHVFMGHFNRWFTSR